MDYKKAFQTASKFVGPEGITSRIRCIPAHGSNRARLFATDAGRQLGVLCELDAGLDVPNCTLDTKMMLKITKEGPITSFSRIGYGAVEVTVGASKYTLEDCAQAIYSVEAYPGFPPLPPTWQAEPEWRLITKAFHGVSKSSDDPALMHVCFKQGIVQTTDKARIIRVKSPSVPREGLVPLAIFKHWPQGEVHSAFFSGAAYFRIGLDEVRMATLQRGFDHYPDLSGFMPEQHEGADTVIKLEPFQRAVKRASDLSPVNLVRMEFDGKNNVLITAWNEQPQTFRAEILCESSGPCDLVVSGKYLLDALEEIETPFVWMGHTKPNEPLRIEAPGDYVELIWPLERSA